MKKVIICLIMLIPILVILTIDASGMLIASALVDIPAESVVIKHGGKVLGSEEVNFEDYDNTGKKFNLFCEVFPGIATDEMIWASSDPSIAEIVDDSKRADATEVKFHDYGSVDIICTSKKNSSISAIATLYIGGQVLGYIQICDYQGNVYDAITMPLYASKSLLASVKPASAAKGHKIVWATSNEDIVSVNENGVISAKGLGEATLSATVTAKGKTVSCSVPVTVTDTALITQKVVYASGNSVDLTEYLYNGATADGGPIVDISALAPFESLDVTVRKSGVTDLLRVTKIQSASTLLIKDYYALSQGAFDAYLAAGTANFALQAMLPDGSIPEGEVTWCSTNENVAVMRGNVLHAVGIGRAEIYPQIEGYGEGQRVEVKVTNPVDAFRLKETLFGDAVGLRQERVFGNVTYLNGAYSNNYTLKIASSSPAGAKQEVFTFKSMDEEVATVDKNGVITFANDVDGKTVEIVATAYNQEGMPVTQQYTFHMVNGVNIGTTVGAQHFDKAKNETPDFSPYWDLKQVAADRSVKSVVLHTDVYFPTKESGGTSILNTTASFYGNGKKLDGQFFVRSVEDTEMLLMWDFATFTDMPEKVDIRITNMNMQATLPTSEDSKEAFTELNTKGGGAIGAKNPYPDGEHNFSLTVTGALFQYAYGHVNISIGDFVFDGCIFRNNSASAIVQQQAHYGVANVKLRNCIFSNTIAPVSIACGNFDDILDRYSGKKTLKAQWGTFELEGNNYVYNWKKLEEVQMNILPKGLDNNNANALVDMFNGYLSKVIREAFMSSDPENLYVDKNGDAWLNFSFLMIGVWDNMNPQFNAPESEEYGIKVNYDEKQYQSWEVYADKAPSIGAFLKKAMKAIGVDLNKNKTFHVIAKDSKGKFNTKPGETYTIGEELYSRLRGED